MLYWLVLGLIVGVLARIISSANAPNGFAVTILLGIAGALLAGYAGTVAGWYEEGERAGLISAAIGAVVILAVFRFASRKR
ncbi:MAG: GlsB/YeaQ/YmgE family stress response membrane protein [Sphingobium sp.]